MDGLSAPPAGGPIRPTPRAPDPVQRWRLTVRRRADAPAQSQRDWQSAWESALAASGLPVAVTDGATDAARPRPRLAFGAPLSQGMPAEREPMEILLLQRLPVWRVREALLEVVPDGNELIGLEDVWLGEPALSGRVVAADYEAVIPGAAADVVGPAVTGLLAADELPRERVRGDRVVPYDLRPFIAELVTVDHPDGCLLRMRLRHDPEKGIGRPEEVVAELGGRLSGELPAAVITRVGLILSEPRGMLPPPDRGVKRPPPTRAGRGGGARPHRG